MIKNWVILSFGLGALLIVLHAGALLRSHSSSRDPNGYDLMVVFFFGVPLAIATSVVSAFALM
jgi:hypothetical protein